MSDSDGMNVKLDACAAQVKKQIICDLCDTTVDEDTTSYCVECSVHMCSTCVKPHSKFPTTCQHTVTKSSDREAAEYRHCDTHKTLHMKFYCTTCQFPICKDCQVQTHFNHACCKVETEIENVKARLQEKKTAVEKIIAEENQHRQQLHRKLGDMKTVQLKVKQNLEEKKLKFEQEFKEVDDANAKLYGKFEKTMTENIKKADEKLVGLQRKAQEIIQLIADLGVKCKTDSVVLQLPDIPIQLPVPTPKCPRLVEDFTPGKAEIKSSSTAVQTCERCMPEGVIRFRFPNVKTCQRDVDYFSDEVTIANIPWWISIFHASDDEELCVELFCDRNDQLEGWWSVEVNCKISLLHPTDPDESLTTQGTETFPLDEDRAIYTICDWTDLKDEGFIEDTAIIVEATVQVKSSSGIPECPICQ